MLEKSLNKIKAFFALTDELQAFTGVCSRKASTMQPGEGAVVGRNRDLQIEGLQICTCWVSYLKSFASQQELRVVAFSALFPSFLTGLEGRYSCIEDVRHLGPFQLHSRVTEPLISQSNSMSGCSRS